MKGKVMKSGAKNTVTWHARKKVRKNRRRRWSSLRWSSFCKALLVLKHTIWLAGDGGVTCHGAVCSDESGGGKQMWYIPLESVAHSLYDTHTAFYRHTYHDDQRKRCDESNDLHCWQIIEWEYVLVLLPLTGRYAHRGKGRSKGVVRRP